MARDKGIRWHIVTCGPRNAAFDAFRTAQAQHPEAFNVLLVDSEAPVQATPGPIYTNGMDGTRAAFQTTAATS